MANGNSKIEQIQRYSQRIFLLNEIIQDTTISDIGIYVYIYLRSIQREDMNLYYISVNAIHYFYTHIMEIKTRTKQKYVEGLVDLESHGLIKRVAESGYEFEYDLSSIYFNPKHTSKENPKYFTVIESNELWEIIRIEDEKNNCIKQKLIRYFVILISTFLKGEKYKIKLSDGNKQDGIVGFQTIETLSGISRLSTDTVILYNSLLEKNHLIYVYRANAIKLIDNKYVSGISNTYGRYKHRDIIIQYGKNHKLEYSYNMKNIRYKSQVTTERKSLGVKLHHLMNRKKQYDKETIIQLYKYAVEYNRSHRDRFDYNEKKKDLKFFYKYDFLEPYFVEDKDLFENEIIQPMQSIKIEEFEEEQFVWGEKDIMDY